MTARSKGLVLAVVHVLLVGSLGAKLLYDRATCPRVWARTAPVDPDLPIRGRYVRLRLEVADGGMTFTDTLEWAEGRLIVRDDRLTVVPDGEGSTVERRTRDGHPIVVLDEALAFFIPEHAADPSNRKPGEELWVEVTLPHAGPPRPIRLGVKRDGAPIVPLAAG